MRLSLLSLSTSLLLWNRFPAAIAVDCNACYYGCKAYQLDCLAKKELCQSTANTFGAVTSGIEATCSNDPSRMAARHLIQDAKGLLVEKNLFDKTEVEAVQYRFCSALGDFAGGLAPSKSKVLLHTDYISESKESVAVLLAHELTHIRQYNRWGTRGFNCRYAAELASGKGFDADNRIEKEAYDFEEDAARCINHNIGCPEKTLRDYHGRCNHVGKSRTPDCVAAMSRFCGDKCDHCGGVSQEVGTTEFAVACFQRGIHHVKVSELQQHHGGCSNNGQSLSVECVAAMHRWCLANGAGEAGIAQEVGSDSFAVACFDATWYGSVSIDDLRQEHGSCDGVHKAQQPGCVAAISRWCSGNDKGQHGLAQELGQGVIGVACFDSSWYGVVDV